MITQTNISNDFFTWSGLEKRTNLESTQFDKCIIKELIDNAIDCIDSSSNINKTIEVNYSNGILEIFDTGQPFNRIELDKVLTDFNVYTSSKRNIISVSRGTQGNALKTISGICSLLNYRLIFQSDNKQIEYKYKLDDVTIDFEIIESSTIDNRKGVIISGFNANNVNMPELIFQYYLANHYINFIYNGTQYKSIDGINPINHDNNIWFYTLQDFTVLLKSNWNYNNNETIKNFIKYFDGMKDKTIDCKGLKFLHEIKDDDDFIRYLFSSIKAIKKEPTLKIMEKYKVNDDTLIKVLSQNYSDVKIELSKDKKLTYNNIPILLQGFLISYAGTTKESLKIISSVNQSISYNDFAFRTITNNFMGRKYDKENLDDIFNKEQLRYYKFQDGNYLLYLSITSPKIEYNDFSKGSISAYNYSKELISLLEYLLKPIVKSIRSHENNIESSKRTNIKSLILQYFDEAFTRAKGDYNSVMARQVFYVLRELINHNTGIDISEKKSIYNTFTQSIVTYFQDKNKKYESIFNERRGFFYETFNNRETPLATREIKDFVNSIYSNKFARELNTFSDFQPSQLYKHVLFIEKQGFTQLFKESNLLDDLNLGLICSQGFGTRASKELMLYFNNQGIKVYCLHDCDLSGYNISKNLSNPSKTFKHHLTIQDIGIKVDDVLKYNKIPEKSISSKKNDLSELTAGEHKFFDGKETGTNTKKYQYNRVEINSFTNNELIEFIKDKIKPIEVIPSDDIFNNCFDIDKIEIAKDILFKKYGAELVKNITVDNSRIKQIYDDDIDNNGKHWTYKLRNVIDDYKNELIENLSKKVI